MAALIKGGCACGAVHYQTNTEPVFSLLCQCRQCQRITGTGHAAQFALLAEAVHSLVMSSSSNLQVTMTILSAVASAPTVAARCLKKLPAIHNFFSFMLQRSINPTHLNRSSSYGIPVNNPGIT